MSASHAVTPSSAPPRLVRLRAVPGGRPLGLVFGAIGVVGGAAVGLLHLDRLPFVLCTFKAMTGLPCPTCGSTRTLGRLAALDPLGALATNPLAAAAALAIAFWAAADLALMPSRRALSLEVHPRLGRPLRIAAFALFFVNWLYLLAVGR